MMKSYLSLISISAKIHKKQSRMTIICIILSVFLVTTIFSMADMGIRMEKARVINKHGNWHIQIKNISKNDSELIASRPDINATSWYNVLNYEIDKDYYIGNKKVAFCGVDEMFVINIMNCIENGAFPKNEKEIMLTSNAKDVLGVNIGDKVTVKTPTNNIDYIISGFCKNENLIMQYDAIGAFMNIPAFNELSNENLSPIYFIQFNERINIRNAIKEIKEIYNFSDENVSENTALLGVTGFSSDSYMLGLYIVAGVLFTLILIAGILMIASSMNTNVSERSQFFGMMRCIGASKSQIIRFVRLEALNWCKIAIPIGVIIGIVLTWLICILLKFAVSSEFYYIPIFQISLIGIICGVTVGILTVLFATHSPAKRASKISPVSAVYNNILTDKKVHCPINTNIFKIETSIGINNAISSKKNLILMVSSFALSIILCLSFSAFLDFVSKAVTPLRPYTPDISIISNDRSCSVDKNLINEIKEKPFVKRAFGRMFKANIPVISNKNINSIDLISFDEYQLNWSKDNIIKGDLSKVYGDSNYALVIYDNYDLLNIGDKLQINGTEIEISGIVTTTQFQLDGVVTLICSEETFTRLTSEENYSVIDIQLTNKASDDDVKIISDLSNNKYVFSDRRNINKETISTYWAFNILVYGFLIIIAIISIFNIMNSISMSVSSKIKQYGAMRAIGMSVKQVTKIIFVESITYALIGSLLGCILGLPIHKFIFKNMITDYFGNAWTIPLLPLILILFLTIITSILSTYNPSKKIKNMSIIDTIYTQ